MKTPPSLVSFCKHCIERLTTVVLGGLTLAMMVLWWSGQSETISVSRLQHGKPDRNQNSAVCFSIQPEKIELWLNLNLKEPIQFSWRRESKTMTS